MNDVLAQTEAGREIARKNWALGFVVGYAQGRAEAMRAQLRARFGDLDDLDNLASRLARYDFEGNLISIFAGATLVQLRMRSKRRTAPPAG